MELTMNVPEIFAVDMRVNLSGRYVGVSEHFLDRSEIRATFEQMIAEDDFLDCIRSALEHSRPAAMDS